MSKEQKIENIKILTSMLNKASEKYYNGLNSEISDPEWDKRYDLLKKLEDETGFSLPDSPTKKVGATVLDEIKKTKLSHDMLSLKKVYSVQDVIDFAENQPIVASIKCDGLSLTLTYQDGMLLNAATRGDGKTGSDVTEAVKYFENVPQTIDKNGVYIIDGEAMIFDNDFEEINNKLPEKDRYSHSRNLAATISTVLDMNVIKQRHMKFVAWDVIEGDDSDSIFERLVNAKNLGFYTVPQCKINDNNLIESTIDGKFEQAKSLGIGCDGVVFKYDSKKYGDTKGHTSHHFNNGVAFKRKNENIETTLEDVEWNTSKTGLINPVAIFKEVDLGGALTTRATLHNISYIEDLELGIGDTITVARKNEVIPKVMDNLTRSNTLAIPTECPCCHNPSEIRKENDSKSLYCTNDDCPAKLTAKIVHFCSKNALDIRDMNESTVDFLVNKKHWVTKFENLYNLEQYKNEWIKCEGFGKKSVEKLLENIEKSRNTSMSRFLYSLSIPLIGKTASKTIEKYFTDLVTNSDGDEFDNPFDIFMYKIRNERPSYWTKLSDFGDKMALSLYLYFSEHISEVEKLSKYFTFESAISSNSKSAKNEKIAESIVGKIFVITGSLEHFSNRNELVTKIEELGGKVSGSVSAKTNYLINNDIGSNSSKNKKAKELNVAIITEMDFLKFIS